MGKRVLLADDSVTIQRAFAMVFGGQQDVSVATAKSLDEALTAARQGRPDLVIADLALGTRTGYELCQAIKADASLRGVPVYILASNHNPYDEARGRQAGADGFFMKPFESQALLDGVQDALSKAAAVAAPAGRPQAAIPVLADDLGDPARRPTTEIEIDADLEDDYGDFTIERASPSVPPAPPARPASSPAFGVVAPASRPPSQPSLAAAVAPPPAGGAGLRPSLIPGARPAAPAAPPPARPPSSPATPAVRPPQPGLSPAPAASASAATRSAASGRTIMGLPAMAPQGLGGQATRPPSSPAAPVPAAVSGLQARSAPPSPSSSPAPGSSPALGAIVASRVDQKMATLAAKGPEYEAIAKLSREIIEQVVWEVVPELAEAIIRQEVDRLANARK
jgi:CheY-like chemotaxis protein